jgi:hypothetical protein
MTKTRDLANLVSGSNPLVDGVIDYSEITNTPAPFDPNTLAAVAVSGSYADLGGKPALATVATSGSFTDLSNQPAPFNPATLAAVAVSGAYADVTGTPTLAAVATSGSYSSLSGTPAAALPLTGGTLSGTLSTPSLNIGGTQVISTARALNNIASIDATTAASFAAGGVGGLSTLVAEDVSIAGGSSAIVLTLGNYKQQTFWIYDLRGYQEDLLHMRLTNSSGSTITTGTYVAMAKYDNSSWGMFRDNTKVYGLGGGTLYLPTTAQVNQSPYGQRYHARITVWDAYYSNRNTTFETHARKIITNGGGANAGGGVILGTMEVAEKNNSLVLFPDVANFASGTYTTYTSIGVN